MKTQAELIQLLSENRISDVFEALVQSQPKSENALVLLQSKWHALKSQEVAGAIDSQELELGYAQVRQGLLNIIKGEVHSAPDGKPGLESRFWMFALLGALAIGLASALYVVLDSKKSAPTIAQTTSPDAEQSRLESLVSTSSPASTASSTFVIPPDAVLINNDVTLKIESATLEPATDTESRLLVKILCKNDGRYDYHFYDGGFRIRAAGSEWRISPTGALSEVVEARSDKVGVARFMVPSSASYFDIIITEGEATKTVRLER